MPKLIYHCPVCEKQLKLKREFTLGTSKLFEYTCGHIFAKTMDGIDRSSLDFTSADGSGKVARKYQEDSVVFILENNFNAVIGHQMRLGKTPISLLALKNKFAERTPVLILARSANVWQWVREFKTWTSTLPNGIFAITSTTGWIPLGFSAYIVSMDTFSRDAACTCGHTFHEKECRSKKCSCKQYVSTGDGIRDKLKKIPFKLIIADEAHSFKNSGSNRSQALVDFVSFFNTGEVASEDKPCGLILLTGTPILNRADEYFVPLNLTNPEKFSSHEAFRRKWLTDDFKRVKPYLIEEFKKEISNIVLRYTKEDVYTDLPKLNKIYTLIEPDKSSIENLSQKYNETLDKLEIKMANKISFNFYDMQDSLMELRRLCGLMKLPWTRDYLESCALESATKYAIGIHHVSVRDILYVTLGGSMNCYKLSGEESSEQKDRIMREWETSTRQFLIINMLAGGIGMDFHYCDNVVVLERQWNAPTEEQFEFRFYNPDKSIKKNPTNIEYILAKGTLDEWWYNMIEEKKHNVGEIAYHEWDLTKDAQSFRELMEQTVRARL
jgi:SNF2 family DNA or RNA helicase